MTTIPLRSILPEGFDPMQYKMHCAVYNQKEHPIEALATNWDAWTLWNRYRGTNNDFNRQFIFSVARDRKEPSLWLFGGIWEVLSRDPTPRSYSYEVRLREDLMGPFIKRLVLRFEPSGRAKRLKMEEHLDQFSVHSILDAPYAGEAFPGLDQINHTMAELQVVVRQQRPDWFNALQHMKGVYVWHDRTNGEPYVGAAYSETGGIWSRLSGYVQTLDGGNEGLKALRKAKGDDYMRENLSFALLEFWAWRTDDQLVIDRENYWKQVLLSRKKDGGLNHN